MTLHNRSPILITGGTGTLGRHVVPLLLDAAHDLRILSRQARPRADGVEYVTGDLATGDGVEAAVDGAELILHLAGSNKNDDTKAHHLTRAAARAGVGHLVFISVVGADRIPIESAIDRMMFGYFGAKLAAERAVAESGLPWTTLRVTQLHQSMLKVAQSTSKLPVVPAPDFRFQPVDAGEVAGRLVSLALDPPARLVPDMGGPRAHSLRDLLRTYLRTRGKHRLIVPVPTFGKAAAAFRGGANLASDRVVGRLSWEDFLTGTFGSRSALAPTASLR